MTALLGLLLQELGYDVSHSAGLDSTARRLQAFYPVYRELKQVLKRSRFSKFLVGKDSGGIQEESTWHPVSNATREYRAPNYGSYGDECFGRPRSGKTAQGIVASARGQSKERICAAPLGWTRRTAYRGYSHETAVTGLGAELNRYFNLQATSEVTYYFETAKS